jgi:hypothetical protein
MARVTDAARALTTVGGIRLLKLLKQRPWLRGAAWLNKQRARADNGATGGITPVDEKD